MTDDDVLAIKAYLFTLKPIHYAHPRDNVAFPFNQRYLMVFWNMLFEPAHRFQPNADQPADWNRGAYLVEALGHCGDCHTPRNILFGLNNHRKFAGALIQGWKAYNITSDLKWGIGAWSNAQLQDYLAHGHADGRSSASGPMAEVVDNSLRFLTQDDIGAMSTYVRSVPSKASTGELAVATPPATEGQSLKPILAETNGNPLGLDIFEGACVGCHSFDGDGAVSKYAALLGTRTINDPAGTNATRVLLQGTHLDAAIGKEFMPGFGNGYSDAEVAAVVNYVTAQFGTPSAVSPEDVAKRRQAN
jgi:mono/diheme cytochrome c family protein